MNSWPRCIIWLVLYGAIYEIVGDNTIKSIALAVYMIALLYYLYKRDRLKEYRVVMPQRLKMSRESVASLVVLGNVVLMNLLFYLSMDNYSFSLGICLGMLYAVFVEELFFRGYLLTTLLYDCGNPRKSIIKSGVLFGVLHLVNLFRGVEIVYTVFQTLCAVEIGILLGILAITFDSILPGVVLHWLINVTAMWVKTLNVRECSIYLVVLIVGVVLCLKKYNGGDSR